jgi:hypothetical protein
MKTIDGTFAVWWASAGCLPDSETPAFVGTLEECEEYAKADPDGFYEDLSEHNLYSFSIYPYNEQEDI